MAVRYAPETGVKSLSTSLMTQSRYLRLTMVSSLSSPGTRQPLCRRPRTLSSSRRRSRTAGWRRSCMMSEVLALAVVAKAAKISSIVDSCVRGGGGRKESEAACQRAGSSKPFWLVSSDSYSLPPGHKFSERSPPPPPAGRRPVARISESGESGNIDASVVRRSRVAVAVSQGGGSTEHAIYDRRPLSDP
ncbi:hypothetical protein EYF80_026523 [Liparis tanakae]|uniref:Uncharacterized protein n=1 Tax=Liparis tanakae TaxID=230148 RepID=A0A4Z2HER2_9TELE|nr:hypothetical protein EYF80_026523 [Liparis tanakae]